MKLIEQLLKRTILDGKPQPAFDVLRQFLIVFIDEKIECGRIAQDDAGFDGQALPGVVMDLFLDFIDGARKILRE